MLLKIDSSVEKKLIEKHSVTIAEVYQALRNCQMKHRKEKRAEHLTSPTTRWLISQTDEGRILKICYIPGNPPKLKSAFPIEE